MKNGYKISRRAFCGVLGLGTAALAMVACGEKGSSAAPQPEATPLPEPVLDAADYPLVDGSTACIPLMASMRQVLTGGDLTEIQTGITVSTTGYAWEKIGLYEKNEYMPDLLVVYEAPQYIQDEIAAEGTQLEVTPIGRDALVFIVNEQNPVKSLTRQQVVDIYTGRITNWSEVGGEDAPIVAFQRSEDSGSQTLFKKLAMNGEEPMEAPTELAPTEMGGLVDSLAEYNNAGNAIGFSVYYYIQQMYSKPGLRLIAIDDVTPGTETIADKSYPYCNEFFAVIRAGEPLDSPARIVYDWITGPEGAACVAANGYVPVQSTSGNG